MSNNSSSKEISIWKNGYTFALFLLFVNGLLLIYIGTQLPEGSLWNEILVGSGIAMAPSAVVAQLFRIFLFKEVQYELTYPVLDEIRARLGPQIMEQLRFTIQDYRDEIALLRSMRDAGVIRPYKHREVALRDFASAIDAETNEIMVIGSSLKGLLQQKEYEVIADKLRFKISKGAVTVRFLLTHPVVADLRARQEGRRFTEIGTEIINSLRTLQEWGVPPENVRLYKGTPTCFAIKTRTKMFLNPYPYGAVAYDSPCLIVETSEEHPSYFYEAFDKSHFRAWDTDVATKIFSYEQTIHELQSKLTTYADLVAKMLEA